MSEYNVEKIAEQISCTNLLFELDDIQNWIKNKKDNFKTQVNQYPINNMREWEVKKNGSIEHSSGKFYKIIGVKVGPNSDREVKKTGWEQPLIKEYNNIGGLLGLIRTKIEGLPHYLIQAKFEPGNYGIFQLSPTLQATFSNINKIHGGNPPHYFNYFKDYKIKKNYLFNYWFAEDGGRFYKKRNLALIKYVDYKTIPIVNDNFTWMSLYQVQKLIKSNSQVNPHLLRLIFQ